MSALWPAGVVFIVLSGQGFFIFNDPLAFVVSLVSDHGIPILTSRSLAAPPTSGCAAERATPWFLR